MCLLGSQRILGCWTSCKHNIYKHVARCNYEAKISMMLLHAADTEMDRGINQNEGGGNKSWGRWRWVGVRGVVLCSSFVSACAIPEWRQLRYPPKEDESTLCQSFCVHFTLWPTLVDRPTLRSLVRNRLKMQKQLSLLQAPAHFVSFSGGWIKLRHCWTPAINEILRAYAEYLMRCTALSRIPLPWKRFNLWAVFCFYCCFVVIFSPSAQLQSCLSDAPFVFGCQSDKQPLSPSWSREQYTLLSLSTSSPITIFHLLLFFLLP